MADTDPGTKEEQEKHALEAQIVTLKQRKSKSKAWFTRSRNSLLDLCKSDDVTSEELKGSLNKLEEHMDKYIECLDELVELMKSAGKTKDMTQVTLEIEQCENSYDEAMKDYHEAQSEIKSSHSQSSEKDDPEPTALGKDMWKQLKRVSIPVFDGEIRKYEAWKAAFVSCIDAAPATDEYKLLQLRQYLSGSALKAIDELGHSASAYKAAKERLERKFGGSRRKVTKYLDDLDRFKYIEQENAKSIDRFVDLLDIAVINLQESGHHEDLKNGALYIRLLRKMPESMITRYNRWIFENDEQENVETLRNWVIQEAKFYVAANETKYGIDSNPPKKNQRTFFANEIPKKCPMCSGSCRGLWDCSRFDQLNLHERWQKAKELKVCYRCLKPGHSGKECKNFRKCNIPGCGKVHHRLLHKMPAAESQLNPKANEFQHVTAHSKSENYVALRTVPVVLRNGTRSVRVNALLDDGSTKTYINSEIAEKLQLYGDSKTVQINVLDGQVKTFETMPVNFQLESIDGVTKVEVHAFTVEKVTGNLKVVDWSEKSMNYEHLKDIHFPRVETKPVVDILIGIDYAELHRCITERYGKVGEPIARLGPLGWTCIGKPNLEDESVYTSLFVKSDDIGEILRDFWEIEKQGTEKSDITYSRLDKQIMKETRESMTYDGERYEVAIPWNENKQSLSKNEKLATKRLENTVYRLNKNPEVKEHYENVIENYIENQYIVKVDENKHGESKWLLPHFPVVKLGRDTTKVRMVFDASAKHETLSLNDAINQGPKLQGDLFDILNRFRKHSVALVCDIKEMYLQVGIVPNDRPYLRFLWQRDTEIETYQFNRVVFGVNASPFLAQFVARENAKTYMNEFPLAAETVLNSTYMDDSLDSVEDEDSGIELYGQITELWKKAGMFARKWLTNSDKVLQHIPVDDRAQEVNLDTDEVPGKKTLGVMWQSKQDLFTFTVDEDKRMETSTKRSVLKIIAGLFDPIGFVSPYIIQGKILMQKMWCDGYSWDESLSDELKGQVEQWVNGLSELKNVKIPRSLNFHKDNKTSGLHVFVDASEVAYSSVAYVRHEQIEGVDIRFICAKTKVAPLKAISIPRLELMAAILGLRIAQSVTRSLGLQMKDVTFWSDSTIVLWWIHRESRTLKPFVGNRVGDIQDSTIPKQWRYVPTHSNPADIGSRGMEANELVNSEIWWNGPEYLQQHEDLWPENKVSEIDNKLTESRKTKTVDIICAHSSETEDMLNTERYSDWKKLTRITAWVYRFINNCRCKIDNRQSGELKVNEVKEAEIQLIQNAQRETFAGEYSMLLKGKQIPKTSKLLKLNPMIDEDGLIRSNSRLQLAKFVSNDAKFPIVLPRKNRITKLIVKYHHELNNHSGTNQVLASISTRYWIEAAREEIREWEHQCNYCKRQKCSQATQIMAPLPDIRLSMPLRAFAHTAVDYAGPYITKQGRGKTRAKRYLCLFTCLASRAVHLEMAYSLDTNSFLNALSRFVSRRGLCKKMSSDNGTNFVSADRELKELVQALDSDKIEKTAANKGIEWTFNPPSAPHFGGVHEAMIKSAKRAVNKVLNNADVTDEELTTAFVGVEGLLNSRPLTYQSSNPADDVVITPNHFLHGQLGGEFAPSSVDTTTYNPTKRWRHVQELIRQVWHRWLKEIIPTLGARKKWFRERTDFKLNDIVLVIDPDSPRGNWPLGKIEDVFPGPDGHVRVVNVRVGTRVLRRPITRLCLLDISD